MKKLTIALTITICILCFLQNDTALAQNYDEIQLRVILMPTTSLETISYDKGKLSLVEQQTIEAENQFSLQVNDLPITTNDTRVTFTITSPLDGDDSFYYSGHLEVCIDDTWYKAPYTGYSLSTASNDVYNIVGYRIDFENGVFLPGKYRFVCEKYVNTIKHIGYAEFEMAHHLNTASTWAIDDIENAISKQLVPHNQQTKYQNYITRANFCDLIMAYLTVSMNMTSNELLAFYGKELDRKAFLDDSLRLSNKSPNYAYALGIVNGVGNSLFEPFAFITREQAAAMLVRAESLLDGTISTIAPTGYIFDEDVSDWAKPYVYAVENLSIMQGIDGSGYFNAQEFLTREQTIVTIFRMYGNKSL